MPVFRLGVCACANSFRNAPQAALRCITAASLRPPGDDAPAGSTSSPTGAGSAAAAQTPPAGAAPMGAKYAIGDTGPNGGIIFAYANGKYKEITKPGQELAWRDLLAHSREWEEARLKPYTHLYDAITKAREEFRRLENVMQKERWALEDEYRQEHNLSEKDDVPNFVKKVRDNHPEYASVYAAVKKAEDAYQAAVSATDSMAPPDKAKAGWRTATAPELIAAFDALKKTGKVNFGNVLYYSSSWKGEEVNQGRDYSRSAVAYAPDAGGMDAAPIYDQNPRDSGSAWMPLFPGYRIILARSGYETRYNIMDMADGAIFLISHFLLDDAAKKAGWKNVTVGDIRIPYVKEF